MDWNISKIKRIKENLLYLGVIQEVKQGSMAGKILVHHVEAGIKEGFDPVHFCPSGRLWGTDLGGALGCHECEVPDKCIEVCFELEGEAGINARDVFLNDDCET